MGSVSSEPIFRLYKKEFNLHTRHWAKLNGDGEIIWGRAFFSTIQLMSFLLF